MIFFLYLLQTGARVTHEEIKDNWLGNDTPFGYFDGYLESCLPFPGDHGTFVVSNACGKNLGVANESRWMMCRMCQDSCEESAIKLCMQWASCPYECGDNSESKITKNCTFTPHVVRIKWIFTLNINLLFFSENKKIF